MSRIAWYRRANIAVEVYPMEQLVKDTSQSCGE